jgi:hypothetical protein
VVTIETEVRDPVAVADACHRLSLPEPVVGSVRLFSADVAGLLVQLPRWRYPVVCQTDEGKILFDNFGGRWGGQVELDKFLQRYAVEKARLEARKQGFDVTETQLESGAIKLTVQIGGGT